MGEMAAAEADRMIQVADRALSIVASSPDVRRSFGQLADAHPGRDRPRVTLSPLAARSPAADGSFVARYLLGISAPTAEGTLSLSPEMFRGTNPDGAVIEAIRTATRGKDGFEFGRHVETFDRVEKTERGATRAFVSYEVVELKIYPAVK